MWIIVNSETFLSKIKGIAENNYDLILTQS